MIVLTHRLKLTRISSSTQVFSTPKAHNVIVTWKIRLYRYLLKEIREKVIDHFYITIKSLPKHYAELEIYLNSSNFKISFPRNMASSVYKQGLYELLVWKLSLYIADYLKFKHRHDLEQWDGVFVHWHWGGCLILIVTWSLEYYIECPMLVLMLVMKICVTF